MRPVLDPRRVEEKLDDVRAALARRGPDAVVLLGEAAKVSADRRAAILRGDQLREARNAANAAMAAADKKSAEFAAKRDELRAIGAEVKTLEETVKTCDARLGEILLGVPNTPHPSVPDGKTSDDNPVLRSWGEKASYSFAPKPHWDLGEALGILDFPRATKISGPRFAVHVGQSARLGRALAAFMIDVHVKEHGYREVYPPAIVLGSAMQGTGQLPKFREDAFKLEGSDHYLVPTAEVPVTNLHADEVLDAATLPRKYVAWTPCFRAESGSAGKDTRGLIRNHQFDKVELVQLVEPERSYDVLEELTAHAEAILKKLGLHHRVVSLCAGDLGFGSAKTYDLEVWLPGQDRYREISSCSNFEDFQARRASIRFKREAGKPRLVHTLNGSGLAVGRTIVAILEQCQEADGTVTIPDALRPYFGADRIVPEPGL
jgi:seryl-tRNA synthetase